MLSRPRLQSFIRTLRKTNVPARFSLRILRREYIIGITIRDSYSMQFEDSGPENKGVTISALEQ